MISGTQKKEIEKCGKKKVSAWNQGTPTDIVKQKEITVQGGLKKFNKVGKRIKKKEGTEVNTCRTS